MLKGHLLDLGSSTLLRRYVYTPAYLLSFFVAEQVCYLIAQLFVSILSSGPLNMRLRHDISGNNIIR